MKTEIIFGFHPVLESIKAGKRRIYEIYITRGKESKRVEKLLSIIEAEKTQIRTIRPDDLASLTGNGSHQGIAAKVSVFQTVSLSQMIDSTGSSKAPPLLLLLDSIKDIHNLGAIVRTAFCFGFDGIVTPKDRSAPPSPGVSKTSAGALEHVLMARETNISNTIKALKKKGFWIVGTDMNEGTPLFSSDLSGPVAIVIGGEEKGIRPLVKKNCDYLVTIPQEGNFNSLNASVAGAIVMYEAFRQRQLGV